MLAFAIGIAVIIVAMMLVGTADIPQETLDLIHLVLWAMLILMFLPFIVIGAMFLIGIFVTR